MDYNQLVAALNQLGVSPPDVYRASLYYDYLTQARNFFNLTMAGAAPAGLGADYGFVRTAVQSASLLNTFAESLDLYIGPAVDRDLQLHRGQTYQQYFLNQILGPNYATNLNAFRGRFPVSTVALGHLLGHFTGNIREACQRVIADRALLDNFFRNLNNDSSDLVALVKIKSSGSDFHKGGKQVLILSFRTMNLEQGDPLPTYSLRQVVYKPSDIEIDCLITGKSAVINSVVPGFMAASLFEIYNQALDTYRATHPGFTGERLPTYGILPRNYLSAHAGGLPVPIRNAYGYIQYLDHDLSGTSVRFFGYYPFGGSDYLIFKGQDAAAIKKKFYRIEGTLSALACTFSIHDLHLENLRVKSYLPYFIDLEDSLTEPTNSIADTLLISDINGEAAGGINGISLAAQDYHWGLYRPTNPAQAGLEKVFERKYYQNRLWTWSGTQHKQLIPVSIPDLLAGFRDGMTLLRTAQQNNNFNAWFARLNNVVVRYIPYPTAYFKNNLLSPYYLNSATAGGNVPLQDIVRGNLTDKANAYAAPHNPDFLVLTPTEALVDVQNLDVPVYYYRIGTLDILNSFGNQVPIPANIIVDNPNPPPPAVNQAVAIGRATFFANIPTTAIVNAGQVQALVLPVFPARELALQYSIRAGMSAGNAPNPVVVIPINP